MTKAWPVGISACCRLPPLSWVGAQVAISSTDVGMQVAFNKETSAVKEKQVHLMGRKLLKTRQGHDRELI